MRNRLIVAMIAYAFLGIMAALTLTDWRFRTLVWVVLGGTAVKTWIAYRSGE